MEEYCNMALEDKILEVIKGPKLSAIGTVIEESGQILPVVRYMITMGRDDLILTAFTSASSRKVSQIEKNVKNPEDPKYVAIRFVPSLIEYYSKGQVKIWKN